jgi:hypothetical protein
MLLDYYNNLLHNMYMVTLSQEQQEITAQNILYAAELLRNGASISKFGTLMLAGSQLENVQFSDDPFLSRESMLIAWLNTKVTDLLPQETTTDKRLSARINGHMYRLDRPNNPRIKDILHSGRTRVRSWNGIGSTALNAITDVVSDNPFGLELHRKGQKMTILYGMTVERMEELGLVLDADRNLPEDDFSFGI